MEAFKGQNQAFFENCKKNAVNAYDVADLLGKFSLATVKGTVYFLVGERVVLMGNAKTDKYSMLNLKSDTVLSCENVGCEMMAQLENAFPKAKNITYTVYNEPPPAPVHEQEIVSEVSAPVPLEELPAAAAPAAAVAEESTTKTQAPSLKKKKAVMRKRPVLSGGGEAVSESQDEIVKKEKIVEEK